MEKQFVALLHQLSDQKPETFLRELQKRGITDYCDYLLFQDETTEMNFYQSLDFLCSATTLQKTDLSKLTDFQIIAQTIDGDYLAADPTHTYVIPSSLNKNDIEVYPKPISQFLVAYTNGEIESSILAPIA